MKYVKLGRSGLDVSRIALGCMSFGDATKGFNTWSLGDDEAEPVFRTAVELGITLWDTANVYGFGSSEEIVGRAIKRYTRRDDIVLATKVYFPMHEGPGGSGLSRKAIVQQLDASLKRLDTDYVDLYQIHRFDPYTPVEETMGTLDDLVRAGKVRYVGACSMHAWQLATMQHTAARRGREAFVSMQHQYSLLQRRDEEELLGLLAAEGIGSMPWSPLGRGWLTRPWGSRTRRGLDDPTATRAFDERHRPVVDAVQSVSEERGVSMAVVALAWVLRNPSVASPIVGATDPRHLTDAVSALDLSLDDDEVAALEGAYPRRLPRPF